MYQTEEITIDIVIFDGCKALEAIGALSVFHYANLHLQRRRIDGRYDVQLVSTKRGPCVTDTGVPLYATKMLSRLSLPHTAMIVGAWSIEQALDRAHEIVEWVEAAFDRLERLAALCSGAFFLAAAGLLDGVRATTHWAVADALRARYPAVRVDTDCIFIHAGKLWTSAGVTAGIDLALALVEADFGRDVALDVARDLVVFLKRPGGQSQFSSHLMSQTTHHPSIRDIQDWMLENCQKELSASQMADRLSMSVRSFNRCFKKETGMTPSGFLTRIRIEAARRMLEEGRLPAKTVAANAGFKTYETMRKAFQSALNVTPLEYRERFGAVQRHGDGNVRRSP
ncbi:MULTISPECIES: GlxA family transcriptional regulator [Burkholderia]|uniref:AraC family transcriptional regulator n=1 Tax=Burkholderia anthina TaxID=179879 RepID=A0A6P2G755_9BURK|nr:MULTISPECIES: helix-turn-helix domain-containing protein [Burkholderia]AXK67700.1 helix-turn-helix domain-containing protein [Burkholderia sp. IDO3]MBM2769280.1 helix-turn-helix domain-containing protein [Burkholderia anthina]PCD59120.1 AraC family transcriptional regulator [Burkholderia sp. IDO3]QTD95209.1 helix-turn-helix domain-containing protein [Burkholderia anthina]VVU48951.1 AraC family transcriptional regulator [Burkholderia anthina]